MPRHSAVKASLSANKPSKSEVAAFTAWMWVMASAVVAAALVLRIVAARGDVWVDEIWSINFAREAATPLDILRQRIDNNHLLNTWILYLVRDQQDFWVFRVHSIIASTVSVALAGVLVRRWAGNAAAIFAMLLMAFSYVMINYGSEARGYAMQVMFLLGALLAADRGLTRCSWSWAIVFWFCCALGFLSHALFLHGYAALLAWSAWRMWRTDATRARRVAALSMYHVVPLVVAATLYFSFVRHLKIAGASRSPLWETICHTAAFALGTPRLGGWTAMAFFAAIAILICGAIILCRMRRDVWVFFIFACFIAPAAIAWISSADFLLPRYFLIPIVSLLLLLAVILGQLWNVGINGRLLAGFLVIAFAAGNLIDTRRLLIDGRGHYVDAMRYIVEHSHERDIRIAGDHGERQSAIVRFYSPYVQTDKRIEFVPGDQVIERPPHWMLLHRWEGQAEPSDLITAEFEQPMSFERRAAFNASPLGGWRCYVYERVGR